MRRIEPVLTRRQQTPESSKINEEEITSIDDSEPAMPAEIFRVVDWKAMIFMPLVIAFCGFWGAAIIAGGFEHGAGRLLGPVVFWASIVGALANFIVLSKGVVLDSGANEMSYPAWVFRRSIPLDRIYDANCQTYSYKGSNKPSLFGNKSYAINLSGDFESRRVVFESKYKRDQFLSFLRRCVPSCRITRWT